ncbi:uncharacterized protein CTRU02_214805 [Colletotrichum truncatum]|uniref:Uncharacterized protein n=2 Tax=Colletotrichum truncatum TaxID=5467 RepID=A0ACC3YQD2_COLTU|nr:uncharacterized protein CTRU02_13933 [Colletotrichum truncatum]XP_036582362.1 uncharacterized protein CTRU02_07406 [Colletotrichum truncatum]KAF6782776.1 hypothetical protein CTRU02_13933 [Colletotrichum truncatum]KAF6791066.1 hypothetical protein CTRU02_07406 [Colletotrichum truncatum]
MDGNKRPRTALTRDVSMGRLSLACPYYKHDKIRHQACLKLELQRIRDVKQHLRRKHKQPHFCSTCGQEFDKLDEQRKHSRPQQCRMRNFAEPEGITEDQEKLLASKVDKKSTLADQWFSVWDIVFSGTPRPKSAYVNSLVCEVMSSLREFWRAKGKEIVSDHIRGKRGLSYSIEDEERALEMVYSSTEDGMLDAVIDRFVSVYDTSSSPGKTTADGSSSSAYGNPSLGTVITDESLPQLSDTQFEPKIDELTKPPLHDTLVNYDAETQPAAAGMTEDQFEAFLADFYFDASAGQDMLGGPPGADGPSTDPSF